MDLNTILIAVAIASLAAFAAIVWWLYWPARLLMLKEEGRRAPSEHE